jgi:hypothetical protein
VDIVLSLSSFLTAISFDFNYPNARYLHENKDGHRNAVE